MAKAVASFTISDLYDGEQGESAIQAVLSNESHTLTADSSGVPISYIGAETTIYVYEGTTDVTSQYIITKSDATGITSSLSGATVSVTAITNGIGGDITITATKGTTVLTKVFSISVSKTGADGQQGPGAKIVTIAPSAQMFRQEGGSFVPQYIYLYPDFQNCNYSKWQYSISGAAWYDVTSGSHSLTIDTYDSIDNTLRIENNCDLYSNSITSISFRCVSDDTSVFDIVSIVKLSSASGSANYARIISPYGEFIYDLSHPDEISPATIELVPSIDGVSFSSWTFSVDGMTTWENISQASDCLSLNGTTLVITGIVETQEQGETVYNLASIFNQTKSVIFKLNTSDNSIYDLIEIKLNDTDYIDMSGYATQNDLNLRSNKVWIEQPTPPYKEGDIWIVQDETDPNFGKFITCVRGNSDPNGTFDISDWIVPLTAYTTVETFTQITGQSPGEWEVGEKSLTQLINENTGAVESATEQMSKLSIRTSDIEMSFSKTGTSNFLQNSSGQYGTRYWELTGTGSTDKLSTSTIESTSDVRTKIESGYAFTLSDAGTNEWTLKSSFFVPPINSDKGFTLSYKFKNMCDRTILHVEVRGYIGSDTDSSTGTLIISKDEIYTNDEDFRLGHISGIIDDDDIVKLKVIFTIKPCPAGTVTFTTQPDLNSLEAYSVAGNRCTIASTDTYCLATMQAVNIVTTQPDLNDMSPSTYWYCTDNVYDETTGVILFIRGVYYYKSKDVNDNLIFEPVTDSFTITQLDKEDYMIPVPVEFTSTVTPVTGTLYIGDIMVNGGNSVKTWTPRQDEVLYGSKIKFSSDGITLIGQNDYKRELKEDLDVAYKVDVSGTPIECVWRLNKDGMFVKDIYCYGTFNMGTVVNTGSNLGNFTPKFQMSRSVGNDGIDEYIY